MAAGADGSSSGTPAAQSGHSGGRHESKAARPVVSIRNPRSVKNVAPRVAQHVESADDDGDGAVGLDLRQRRAQRRSRAHHVINERDTLAEQAMAGAVRQLIPRGEGSAAIARNRRREIEVAAQESRDELREKRAAGERPAHRLDVVAPERLRELGDERIERGLIDERGLEIEPESAMQARFQLKVASPRPGEIEKRRHRPSIVAVLAIQSVTAGGLADLRALRPACSAACRRGRGTRTRARRSDRPRRRSSRRRSRTRR